MTQSASRGRFVASILLTALLAGAAIMLAGGGIASGSPSSAQYEYGHPAPTAPPTISGTAQVGQTLTTTNGAWSSSSNVSLFAYSWGRCDANGASCVAIGGASSNTYTLVDADKGHTIRSYVTATNSAGSTQSVSDPTAVVAAPAVPTGKQIAAANVTLPNRLVVDRVSYSANPIRARHTPTTMKIHVADSHANSVSGALVYAIGVPYNRIANMAEVTTDATGWATLQLQPTRQFPRTGYLVLFVRARVQGQDLLGGTSTRRLVQVTIGAPNGS
ncbi:MAG TPA: hypothetical protein VFA82_09700 [Gaiellaceae bacterium]|nr:hypothetical protein [Gaiellaceae bacterium]